MDPSTLLEAAADAEPAVLFWSLAGTLLLLAVIAAWAEYRRGKRRDLDSVGWVSWNLVQVLAFLGAVCAAVLALKS